MVSNTSLSNVSRYSPHFAGENQTENISPAEKFINDVTQTIEAQEKGNFLSKYLWSQTAMLAAGLPVLGYEAFSIAKITRLSKSGDKAAKKAFSSKALKVLPLLIGGSVILFAGLQYLFSRNADKKCEKFRQDFLDINTTSAKLREQVIKSSYIGAKCSPIAEEITVNKNLILDPMTKRKLQKIVKHELVHARQYETIVRSENGLKKLNYAVLYSTAKNLNNPEARAEIESIYQDISNDKSGKYDNFPLHISGADVDLKKYIEGLRTLLENPEAGFDDVPIVIDEEHYKKIITDSKPLTEEEEKKAEKYYQALLNYPPLTFWNMINPFSKYYGNILESEAYKENPNFITAIRHLFIKD